MDPKSNPEKIVKCRTCGAEIFFIRYKDKFHPVNLKPKKLFVLTKKYYDLMEAGFWKVTECYESHFSSCPDAEHWRKKKKTKEINGNR